MKTISAMIRLALPAVFIALTMQGFAQNKPEGNEQQKYRLYIVKSDNGSKEVIDKTFSTREELDAYVKENKVKMPGETQEEDLSNSQTIVSEQKDKEKPSGKHAIKKVTKKITIVEKEESQGGKTEMEIISDDLSPEDRAKIEQEALNIKDGEVEMIVVNKIGKEKVEQTSLATEPIPTGVTETKANKEDNISDMKLYPNPSNGQFRVEFKIGRSTDVKLRITDLQGKEVYAEALNNYSGQYEKSINREDLSGGTYIMYLEAGGEKKVTKVVMQ